MKREKHERSNYWELNLGQLVMTTSALPLSYNCHSNASLMLWVTYILLISDSPPISLAILLMTLLASAIQHLRSI